MDFGNTRAIVIENGNEIKMEIEGGGFKAFRIVLKKEPEYNFEERKERAIEAINELNFANKDEVVEKFLQFNI